MKRWIIHLVLVLASLPAFAMSSWRPPIEINNAAPTSNYVFGGTGALPTAWKKYGTAWVRVEENGNLSCLAFDGVNCDTSNLPSVPTNKTATPLVCGLSHKQIYGITGYDTSGHWCNMAYASLFASWQSNGHAMFSQNPYGDVMCLSDDGINCKATTTPPPSGTIFNPLVCGKIHQKYWGIDGYTSEEHWCNRGLKKFTLAITSDPQYPWLNEGGIPSSGNAAQDSSQSITQTYNSINDFNSKTRVAGVVINGDVTAYGHTNEWSWMNGRLDSLQPPIFLSLGNHDYENNVNDCQSNECVKNSLDNLERYASRYATSFDRAYSQIAWQKGYVGSFAWSRDIGSIHYVFLNNEPTYSFTSGGFKIQSAIPWLDRDLQKARAAGKAIVLVHHKPFDEFKGSDGFTKDMFEAMVRKYSVSAIFLGHLHSNGGKVGTFGGATTIYSGSASTQSYLLVDFDQDQKAANAYLVKSGNTSGSKPRVATFNLKTPKENLPTTPDLKQSVRIALKNIGGYVAKLKVTYPDGGVYEQDVPVQQDAVFDTPSVPVGSVNVTVQVYTGIAWDWLRTVLNTNVLSHSACWVMWGTTYNAPIESCNF
ncbi:metallophosphoesterase [Limnohabitans sp.]|uniref:metallophosphoesterase n=1 Tax=Limnohabitans sp. TaxID=1907725 RepID=UPI00286F85EF|nr:metallophosphoesterase [Limnohabitans sp.]